MSGLVCDCWLVRHVNLSGWIGRTYLSSLLLINSGAVVEIFRSSSDLVRSPQILNGEEVESNKWWALWRTTSDGLVGFEVNPLSIDPVLRYESFWLGCLWLRRFCLVQVRLGWSEAQYWAAVLDGFFDGWSVKQVRWNSAYRLLHFEHLPHPIIKNKK